MSTDNINNDKQIPADAPVPSPIEMPKQQQTVTAPEPPQPTPPPPVAAAQVTAQTPITPQPPPQPASSPAETVLNIPGYEIIGKIGEGTTSVVWKAKQQSLARTVAIKVLKQKYSDSPEDVQNFIDEARSVAKLKSHNIIHIYDVGRFESTYYFVMEFVDGETLGQLLEKEDKLSRKRSLTIIRAIAEGLEGAWNSCQIIHRDIKPENIMIDTDGRVKIADLGLASIVKPREGKNAATEAMSGSLAGTPNYMSPEQARSVAHLDSRSDMYSLGALLYHMVTGKLPFENKNPVEVLQSQVSGQLTNPRTLVPSISIGFSQLITRLMMKIPNDRFRNWTEAVANIKKVASGKIIVGSKSSDAISTIAPPGKDPVNNLPTQPDLLSKTVPAPPPEKPKQPGKKSFVFKKRQRHTLTTPVMSPTSPDIQHPTPPIPSPQNTADMPDATTNTPTLSDTKEEKGTPLETQPTKPAWWITAMIWIFILGWLGLTRWSLTQLPTPTEIPPATANTLKTEGLHISETAPDFTSTPETQRSAPAILDNKAHLPSDLPAPQASTLAKATADSTPDRQEPRHSPSALPLPPPQTTVDIPQRTPTRPISTPHNIMPLKKQVLDCIISSNPQSANALITKERNAQRYAIADIDNLSSLIRHATAPNKAIKTALRQLIGREISLDISGRTVTVKIKTVVASKITGDRISSSGQSHPITFDINQLGPKEQAQLLANEQSPEMSVLRFALLIKAGDYTNARSIAEQCGSLSVTFSEYTADRILTLIQ